MKTSKLQKLALLSVTARCTAFADQEVTLAKAEEKAIAKHEALQARLNKRLETHDKVTDALNKLALDSAVKEYCASVDKENRLESLDFGIMLLCSNIKNVIVEAIESFDEYIADKIEARVQAERKEQITLNDFIQGAK